MKTTIATLMLLTTFVSTTAFSATKSKKVTMTTEQRQSMATAHEKMAVCLRTDKDTIECQKEMKESCLEVMGKYGCPMMGKMHQMKEMKKDMKEMKNDMKEDMKDN